MPFENHNLGGDYPDTAPLKQEGEALLGGVGALVVLTGQVLRDEAGETFDLLGKPADVDKVYGGFGKDVLQRRLDLLLPETVHIVAVEDPHALQAVQTEVLPQVPQEPDTFAPTAGSLLNVEPCYTAHGFLLEVVGELYHKPRRGQRRAEFLYS